MLCCAVVVGYFCSVWCCSAVVFGYLGIFPCCAVVVGYFCLVLCCGSWVFSIWCIGEERRRRGGPVRGTRGM